MFLVPTVDSSNPALLRVGWDERTADRLFRIGIGWCVNLFAYRDIGPEALRSDLRAHVADASMPFLCQMGVGGLEADLREALARGYRLGHEGHRQLRLLIMEWIGALHRLDPERVRFVSPDCATTLDEAGRWRPGLYVRHGVVEARMLDSYLSDPEGVRAAAARLKAAAELGLDLRSAPRTGHGWLSHDDLDFNVRQMMTNAGFYFGPDSTDDLDDWCDRYLSALQSATNLLLFGGAVPMFLGVQEAIAQHGPVPARAAFPGIPEFYSSLEGQRVLVVTSVAEVVRDQWESGRIFRLYANVDIPHFDLHVIEAPMSVYPNRPDASWSSSFSRLCDEIDDVVSGWEPTLFFASAGCYGLPLTHHANAAHGLTSAYNGHMLTGLMGVRSKGFPEHRRWMRNEDMWRDSNLAGIPGAGLIDHGRYVPAEPGP